MRTFLYCAVSFIVACGSDSSSALPMYDNFDDACDATPGCRTPRVAIGSETESVWRILIERDPTGALSFSQADVVDVEKDLGVPLGRLRGEYLVSAQGAAGEVLDSQLLAFAKTLEIEARGEIFGAESIDLSGETVAATVYLRVSAAAQTFSIEDVAGEEVVSIAVGDLMGKSDASGIGRREQPLSQPASNCPHVLLLEGEQDLDWVPEALVAGIRLTEPGPVQRATLQAALGLMPRLLCHGFTRIAFGDVPARPNLGGVVGIRTGDFITINAAPFSEEVVSTDEKMRMRLLQTIIHEAAHSTEILLNDVGDQGSQFEGDWQSDSRNIALDTIDNVRLRKNMRREWLRMNDAFAALGWANSYPASIFDFLEDFNNAVIKGWSPEDTATNGMMSRYGGQYYADDIAEMVAWSIAGPVARAAGLEEQNNFLEDSACQRARLYDQDNVPSRYAAIFTKLNFVRDLGMILDEDYEQCVGDGLRLPAETPGMHFWAGEDYRRTYGQGVAAQIGTLDGRTIFEMTAEGEATFGDETYPSSARLAIDLAAAGTDIDLVSWPRGVYPLAPQHPHEFQVRLEGAQAGNFDVIDGSILVAQSSNDTLAGSVFVRIGMRYQAPIPVPQTFDPPLTVRFRIEN